MYFFFFQDTSRGQELSHPNDGDDNQVRGSGTSLSRAPNVTPLGAARLGSASSIGWKQREQHSGQMMDVWHPRVTKSLIEILPVPQRAPFILFPSLSEMYSAREPRGPRSPRSPRSLRRAPECAAPVHHGCYSTWGGARP